MNEENTQQDNNTINNIDNNSIQNNSVVNNTNTSVQTNIKQQNSLENSLTNLQDKWTDIIKSLNERMKDLKSIDGLMNEVYLKRQEAIDLFYGTAKILSKQTRDYKTKASSIYLALKSGSSGIRYTNESAINLQIESQLSAEKESVDLLDNFCKYMKDTISTIDNIIYGINNKIKVFEMMNGLKF